MTAVIEIEHLSTRFGETWVHRDLNLVIEKGEVLALVGGSGSGKTTLLRQMIGLLSPTQGQIRLFGEPLFTGDPELLDEPTAGLDPDRSESFVRLIHSLHQQLGLTVVLVTHDLDTLAGLATRVAVLAEQRILALGTIDEIMKVDHPFIRNFFCCDRAQRALQSRISEGTA
jgi:ABC-type transporter Mla maintaining outer membrane lipid asymmetry ATPase subunit MlaF